MSDPNTPTPPVAVVEPPAQVPPAELTIPLEPDDQPETPPAPAAAAPETPPAAPPAPPAPEQPKTVPLSAVLEERNRRQNAEEQLRQARPLIEALNARPDLIAALQAHVSGTPAPNAEQTELETVARDLVLYKADGSGHLDLEAARRVRDYNRAQAKAEAQALIRSEVEPLRQAFTAQTAQSMRERVEQAAKQHGLLDQVRPLIDEAMRADPHAFANDPQIGAALIVTAAGLRAFGNGQTATPAPPAVPSVPATPPTPPLVTENAGRRPAPMVELDPHMQRLAKRRGWDPGKMAKSLDRVSNSTGHVPVEKE